MSWHPAGRKICKEAPWLKFPSLHCKLYLYQFFSKLKSLHGLTGGSIFTNGQGFDVFYAWEKRSEHLKALMSLMITEFLQSLFPMVLRN
jgi:hypothetical protein